MELFIKTRRSGYETDQCGNTFTVQELIDILSAKIEWDEISPDAKIYLANDNGYTFGEVNKDSFFYGEDGDNFENPHKLNMGI